MAKYKSLEVKSLIIEYYKQGKTYREIATALKIGIATVHKWISRYIIDKSLDVKTKPGRRRKTDSTIDQKIYDMSRLNAFKPATNIRRDLNLESVVSIHTVRRRLKERGLKNYVAARKPMLTPQHIQRRLIFASEFEGWTEDQWKNVMFTDEKIFRSDGHLGNRLWREPKTRYLPQHLRIIERHSRHQINVWGAIGAGKCALHLIKNRFFNQKYYIDHILSEYAPKDDSETVYFAYDLSPIHTATACKLWLENHNIKAIPLPAKSADLNPIENLWGELERRTRDRTAGSREELWNIISETFNQIVQGDYIEKLIGSMPKRIQLLKQAEGNWIKY